MYKQFMLIALSLPIHGAYLSIPGHVWTSNILVKKNNSVENLSCCASDFCSLVQKMNLTLCDRAKQALKKDNIFNVNIINNTLHVYCTKQGWLGNYSEQSTVPLFEKPFNFPYILLIYADDNKSFSIDYSKKRTFLLLKALNAS